MRQNQTEREFETAQRKGKRKRSKRRQSQIKRVDDREEIEEEEGKK